LPKTAIDINRVIGMLLVHDIGEIDTGDTISTLKRAWESAKRRNLQAVTRIFGMLPEPQRAKFMALWQEFEHAETPEARFCPCRGPCHACIAQSGQRGTRSWRENASAMSAWYVVLLHRSRPAVLLCGTIWKPASKTCAGKEWFGAD